MKKRIFIAVISIIAIFGFCFQATNAHSTVAAKKTKTFKNNVRVKGKLRVGSIKNVKKSINKRMKIATYDADSNSMIDADKLDSAISGLLIGTGTVDNTEFGYLDGVTSVIQTQLDAKINAGSISDTEFGYLDGVTSAIQTQLDTKGTGNGNMSTSTYDVAGNGSIDADKLDSGISALLIGTGTISNTELGYLNGVTSALQTQLDAKGVGDMTTSTYDVAGNGSIDADKIDSGLAATLIGAGDVSNTEFGYLNGITTAIQTQFTDITAVTDLLDFDATSRITAVGYQAGNVNEDGGTDNVFIGYQAGDANTTADYNIGIGSGALGANESLGHSNTAIGHNAMASISSSGTMNVAVGRNALDSSTGGTWNVAVGFSALGSDGPDGSTAVGHNALSAATGDNNIGIGYQAGNGISSGGSNIAIGYDADFTDGTASNQLNIGDIIKGSVDSSAPRVDIDGAFVFTPPDSDQARLDDSTITIDNGIVRVAGDGGAAVLDSGDAIEDGAVDGQMVIIQGTHDTNTVQIADNVNTALTGVVTLGAGDTLQLIWDKDESLWYEVSRSDN